MAAADTPKTNEKVMERQKKMEEQNICFVLLVFKLIFLFALYLFLIFISF